MTAPIDHDREALVKRLTEEVGRYGVQCSETKELAPSKSLTNALASISAVLHQADYWEGEAKRYAANADFWRERSVAALTAQEEQVGVEFTRADLAKAVSGHAAMAEHDARVYEKTGGSIEIMERKNKYARKLRAAANYIAQGGEQIPHEALHASAPAEHKCADCTMDKEPCPVCYAAWWKLKHHNCSLVGGEQTAETVGDGLCEESDGCPTEIAVLQRFWRKMQTADTVNVPTERRIDLVDPLQFLVELKHLKRRIEAGTATEPEVKFYESNKETAWVNAEHALAAAKERK